MGVRRRFPVAAAGFVYATLAQGQVLLPENHAESQRARQVFEDVWNKRSGDPDMGCRVEVFKPRLDFGLNLWTGYQAEVPLRLDQVREGDRLVTMFRVKSGGGEVSTYFGETEMLPKVPKELEGQQKAMLGSGGGFRVGPGNYKVEWVMAHPVAGVCRKDWSFKVKLPKEVTPTVPPGRVAESGYNVWRGYPPAQSGRGAKVSILVHASPMRWRRNVTRLTSWERNVLLGMLRTVLDRGDVSEARVSVFDLEQGRTFFETERLTRDGYLQIAREMARANFGTIDYKAYQRGTQEWPYLAGKLRQELERSDPSEAVIFLGASTTFGGRVPQELRGFREKLRDVYYIALSPFMRSPEDHISQLVRSLDGKVYGVWEPRDLAKAVLRIREQMTPAAKSGSSSNN